MNTHASMADHFAYRLARMLDRALFDQLDTRAKVHFLLTKLRAAQRSAARAGAPEAAGSPAPPIVPHDFVLLTSAGISSN